jgi:hypothetical protein
MNDQLFRGCGGKKRYHSKTLAKEALKEISKTFKKQGSKLEEYNVYECVFCHYWHIGHRKGLRKRKMDELR